jgi:hypothetical protein
MPILDKEKRESKRDVPLKKVLVGQKSYWQITPYNPAIPL